MNAASPLPGAGTAATPGDGDRLAADLARVRTLALAVRAAGGRALVVGGFTRDEALRRMGRPATSRDVDVEVFGIPFDELRPILAAAGGVDLVGAAFQVAKIRHSSIDVSIPRRESRGSAPRHDALDGDPDMPLSEATRRRDFTIDALALDPLTGELIDEHGGLDDLRAGVLRATDPVLFGDDPLRVVRAMQLVARFELSIEPATVALCRGLDVSGLPGERLGDEWAKLLLRSARPSLGLAAGHELGVVERLHPELAALIGTPQDPLWHPEGDVWTHTLLVVDAAARLVEERDLTADARLAVLFGALCHDLGKPATTRARDDGRIVSQGHDSAGVEPTRSFLAALRAPKDLIARVLPLVRHHLWPAFAPSFTDQAVRRLARLLEPATIELLVLVSRADRRGRGRPDDLPAGARLEHRAAELGVEREATRPIVMGRHLLDLGVEPGPEYSRLLGLLHAAQDEGHFSDVAGGLAYIEELGLLPPRV